MRFHLHLVFLNLKIICAKHCYCDYDADKVHDDNDDERLCVCRNFQESTG